MAGTKALEIAAISIRQRLERNASIVLPRTVQGAGNEFFVLMNHIIHFAARDASDPSGMEHLVAGAFDRLGEHACKSAYCSP